jgi:hypothetical protein
MPLIAIHASAPKKVDAIQEIRFEVAAEMTPLVNETRQILQRRIREQCGIVPEESAADATLILAKEPVMILTKGMNSIQSSTSHPMQPIRPERILQKPL